MEREFYYIIFDTEFGSLNKGGLTNVNVFGNLRYANKKHNFIPVLFDQADAQSVASRMIDKAITFGNIDSHTGSEGAYPVFGAIIVKAKLNGNKIKKVDNVITIVEKNKQRDYEKLFAESDGNDLVVYDAVMPSGNRVSRGVLLDSNRVEIMQLGYLVKTTMDVHTGFCILNNMSNKLKASDVRQLRRLFDYDRKSLRFIDRNDLNDNAKPVTFIQHSDPNNLLTNSNTNMPEYSAQQGGNEEELKKLYKQEKTKYLALKAAQQQGIDIKGGNVDWQKLYRDEKTKYLKNKFNNKNFNWEELYHNEKAKYLAAKDANKMTGGNPFITVNNQTTKKQSPETEEWKKLYKNKKSEYLALRTAQNQGYNISGGNVDWEKLYRTEKTKYLRSKYGNDANWEQLYKDQKAKYLANKK